MSEAPRVSVPSSHMPGTHHAGEPHTMEPRQVMAMRDLFWQNVIREILTSLSMMCALRPAMPPPDTQDQPNESSDEKEHASEAEPAPHADSASPNQSEQAIVQSQRASFDPQLFDGRLAVITRRGERIAIADVFPLFACGIESPHDRVLSLALECTVFQLRTPAGEVYTLPLHEIASFQALTAELMEQLSQMARKRQESETGENGVQQPFGFAAFTSTSRETSPPLTEDSAAE